MGLMKLEEVGCGLATVAVSGVAAEHGDGDLVAGRVSLEVGMGSWVHSKAHGRFNLTGAQTGKVNWERG